MENTILVKPLNNVDITNFNEFKPPRFPQPDLVLESSAPVQHRKPPNCSHEAELRKRLYSSTYHMSLDRASSSLANIVIDSSIDSIEGENNENLHFTLCNINGDSKIQTNFCNTHGSCVSITRSHCSWDTASSNTSSSTSTNNNNTVSTGLYGSEFDLISSPSMCLDDSNGCSDIIGLDLSSHMNSLYYSRLINSPSHGPLSRSISRRVSAVYRNRANVNLEIGKFLFNNCPKEGVYFWLRHHLIQIPSAISSDIPDTVLRAQAIGKFLFKINRIHGGLSQKQVCAYLCEKSSEHIARAYLSCIPLTGLNPPEAFLKCNQHLSISGESEGILHLLDVLSLVYFHQNIEQPIIGVCYPECKERLIELATILQNPAKLHEFTADQLKFNLSSLFYAILVFHKEIYSSCCRQEQLLNSWTSGSRYTNVGSTNGTSVHSHSSVNSKRITSERFCQYIQQCDPLLNRMIAQLTFNCLESNRLGPLPDHTQAVITLQLRLLPQFCGGGGGGSAGGNGLANESTLNAQSMAILSGSARKAGFNKHGLPQSLVNNWRRFIAERQVLQLKPGKKLPSSKKHPRHIILLSDFILICKTSSSSKRVVPWISTLSFSQSSHSSTTPTAANNPCSLPSVPNPHEQDSSPLSLHMVFPLALCKVEILQSPPYPAQSFFISQNAGLPTSSATNTTAAAVLNNTHTAPSAPPQTGKKTANLSSSHEAGRVPAFKHIMLQYCHSATTASIQQQPTNPNSSISDVLHDINNDYEAFIDFMELIREQKIMLHNFEVEKSKLAQQAL